MMIQRCNFSFWTGKIVLVGSFEKNSRPSIESALITYILYNLPAAISRPNLSYLKDS
jgi:hypothetical protein